VSDRDTKTEEEAGSNEHLEVDGNGLEDDGKNPIVC